MGAEKIASAQPKQAAEEKSPPKKSPDYFFQAVSSSLKEELQKHRQQLSWLKAEIESVKLSSSLFSRYNYRQEEYAINGLVEQAERLLKFAEEGNFGSRAEDQRFGLSLINDHLLSIRLAEFAWFDPLLPKGSHTIRGRNVLADIFTDGVKVTEAEAVAGRLSSLVGSGKLQGQFVRDFLNWKANVFFETALGAYELEQSQSKSIASNFQKVSGAFSDYNRLQQAPLDASNLMGRADAMEKLQGAAADFINKVQNESKITELYGGVKIPENLRQEIAGWLDVALTFGAVAIGRFGGERGRVFETAFFSWKASQQMSQGDLPGGAVLLAALWGGRLSGMYRGYNTSAAMLSGSLALSGAGAGAYLFGSIALDMTRDLEEMKKLGVSQEVIRRLLTSGVFTYLGAKGIVEGASALSRSKPGKSLEAPAPKKPKSQKRQEAAEKKAEKLEQKEKKLETKAKELGQKEKKLEKKLEFLSKADDGKPARKLAEAQEMLLGMAEADKKLGKSEVMKFLASPNITNKQFAFYVKTLVGKGFLDKAAEYHLSDPAEAAAFQKALPRYTGLMGSFEMFNATINALENFRPRFSFSLLLSHLNEVQNLIASQPAGRGAKGAKGEPAKSAGQEKATGGRDIQEDGAPGAVAGREGAKKTRGFFQKIRRLAAGGRLPYDETVQLLKTKENAGSVELALMQFKASQLSIPKGKMPEIISLSGENPAVGMQLLLKLAREKPSLLKPHIQGMLDFAGKSREALAVAEELAAKHSEWFSDKQVRNYLRLEVECGGGAWKTMAALAKKRPALVAESIPNMIELVKGRGDSQVLIGSALDSNPGIFSRKHVELLIEPWKDPGRDYWRVSLLGKLSEKRPELFMQSDVGSFLEFELKGDTPYYNGLTGHSHIYDVINSLARNSPQLFASEHIPLLLEAGRGNSHYVSALLEIEAASSRNYLVDGAAKEKIASLNRASCDALLALANESGEALWHMADEIVRNKPGHSGMLRSSILEMPPIAGALSKFKPEFREGLLRDWLIDWPEDANKRDTAQKLRRSLAAVDELEALRPGAANALFEQQGMRFFSRYGKDILRQQYDNLGKRDGSKPLLFMSYPIADWNDAFSDAKSTVNSFSPNFDVKIYEAESGGALAGRIRQAHSQYGPISVWALGGHGTRLVTRLNYGEDWKVNVRWFLKNTGLKDCFVEKPTVIFESCSTGKRIGIARIASTFIYNGFTMYAPRYPGSIGQLNYLGMKKGIHAFDIQWATDQGTSGMGVYGPVKKISGKEMAYEVHGAAPEGNSPRPRGAGAPMGKKGGMQGEENTPASDIEKAKNSPDAAMALFSMSSGKKGYFAKGEVPSLLELGRSSYPGFMVLAGAFKCNPGIFSAKDVSEIIKTSYSPIELGSKIFSGNQLVVNKLTDALLPNHSLLGLEHVRLLSEAASFNPQFLDIIINLSKLEPAGTEKGAAYSGIIARHFNIPKN